jgi:signal transduction histidine kinase
VDALVQDIVETLTPSALKRRVRLGQHVEVALPKLWGDTTRMRQVLLNLTENALKFTPEGGSVRVEAVFTAIERAAGDDDGLVLLSSRQPAIELRVADDGIGIPDAEKDKVFDAFYQVDSSSTRQVGGTGLGLSIVKRLVDAHGGTVHVRDNAPRGTVFVVTIPCRHGTLS